MDSTVRSDRSPVAFADPLPAAVDVVVIGAGVIGISTAWFLRAAGVSVLVCEKGVVAGEQSSRNWGWIRQQARDAAELPIAIDAVNAWEQLAREVGEDIGFARCGILYAARTERELARFERWLPIAERHRLDTRMLTGREVEARIDAAPGQWVGGLYTASDACAEPNSAVPALARALHARGDALREHCAVRSLDMAAGRVAGVVTEAGRVRSSAVVCAAGAWSTRLLGNLDVDLPQLAARATVVRTAPAPNVCEAGALLGEVALRRRPDGGYSVAASSLNEHFVGADTLRYFREFRPALRSSRRFLDVRFGGDVLARLFPARHWNADDVTPFERTRVWNPPPSRDAVAAARAGLAKRLSKLADVPVVEAWAGMIDVTPDVVPVIDAVAQYPGFYVATGFSGHGFGIGPGAGRVVAEMVLGRPARHDLARFRLARFRAGRGGAGVVAASGSATVARTKSREAAVLAKTAADAVVLVHFTFIAFVVFGALLVFRWRAVAWLHVPAALWGAAVEFFGLICPLTPLELRLRELAGEHGYGGDFVDHYVIPAMYPAALTPAIQLWLGAFVVSANVAIYALVLARARRRARRGAHARAAPERST